MKKLIIICCLLSPFWLLAQYSTPNAIAEFTSITVKKVIDSHTNQVQFTFDEDSGHVRARMRPETFHFDIPLMGEHFKTYFLETDKYPTATFDGTIVNIHEINFYTRGNYPIDVEGTMTIHGVSKCVKLKGVMQVSNNKALLNGSMFVQLSDYNIVIPPFVEGSVAEIIEVEITANCKKGRLKS